MAEEKKEKKPKSLARKIIEWVITIIFGAAFLLVAAGTVDGMIHKNENYGQQLRFGYGYFIVETDSMEPYYSVDSAIITHKDKVEEVFKYYCAHKADINAEKDNYYVDVTFMDISNNASISPSNSKYYNNTVGSTHLPMTHRLREMVINENVAYGEGRYIFVVSGTNEAGYQSKVGQYQQFTEKEYLGVVKTNSKFLGGLFNFISSVWGLLILLLIPAVYLVVTSCLDIFKTLKEPEEVAAGDTPSGDTPQVSSSENRLSGLSDADKERLKRELLEQMIAEKKAAMSKEAETKSEETK